MAKQQFSAKFDHGIGTFSFTIVRTNGTGVFPLPVLGRLVDYYQIPSLSGDQSWSLDLPAGDYTVKLIVISSGSLAFKVSPGKLAPDPAHPASSFQQNFLLTV